MYKTLYNNPTERERITYSWTYWDNAFTTEELKKMCDYFSNQGVERGVTVKGQETDANTGITKIVQSPDEEVRVSNVKFYDYDVKNEDTSWIFNRLNFVIESLNNQFYNFNLNGYDSFQYTEYDDYEQGRYDFHMDTITGINKPYNMFGTRKLSLTLLLNEPGVDFEGGDFYFNEGQEKEAKAVEGMHAGRIICFPSFMIHRVAPVTKGTRKSVVVWALGPKFI